MTGSDVLLLLKAVDAIIKLINDASWVGMSDKEIEDAIDKVDDTRSSLVDKLKEMKNDS